MRTPIEILYAWSIHHIIVITVREERLDLANSSCVQGWVNVSLWKTQNTFLPNWDQFQSCLGKIITE